MKKRNLFIKGIILITLLLLLSACNMDKDNQLATGNNISIEADEYGIIIEEDSVIFTDGRGEDVKISKNPKRTVILFASYIDIWLNNGGDIVGMVEAAEEYRIPEIDGVKTVGKLTSTSLEEIIGLDPDLVILSGNTKDQIDMIYTLEMADIEVLTLDYTYKEDYFKTAKLFAAINDQLSSYEDGAKKVRDEIQEILDKVPEENNPSAAIIMSTKSNTRLRTSNTTIGEMFKDLNIVNIVDKENNKEGMLDFSLEKIIEEDPDFIFLQIMGSDVDAAEEKVKKDLETNLAWNSLSAVKNNKYIVLPKDLYTYKANDRYGEAYKGLAEILYPQVFNK